jgi:ribosomal protein S27AE
MATAYSKLKAETFTRMVDGKSPCYCPRCGERLTMAFVRHAGTFGCVKCPTTIVYEEVEKGTPQ